MFCYDLQREAIGLPAVCSEWNSPPTKWSCQNIPNTHDVVFQHNYPTKSKTWSSRHSGLWIRAQADNPERKDISGRNSILKLTLWGKEKKKNAEKHVHNPNPKIPRMNETIVFQTLIHRERDQTLEILQVRQICWELCATRGIAVKTQGDISLLKVVLQFFVAQNHILSAWHGSQDTWQPSSNLATTFMNSSGLTALHPSLSHSPPWSHLISFPSPNTLYFFIFSCPCWGLYWDCFPIFAHDQTSTFDSNAAQMSPFPPISCCVLAIYSHT